MSIELKVEKNSQLLYVTYTGNIDLQQLCEDVLQLTQLPNYEMNWNGISDFSKAKILYCKEDMFEFREFVASLPNASTGCWAVIMPDKESYRNTVIWEVLSDGIHESMYVCHHQKEARDWIKLKQGQKESP
jgi:hypothetical protein